MTPWIMQWLREVARPIAKRWPMPPLTTPRFLEIGSLNVNGSARDALGDLGPYFGIDRQVGPGVDLVGSLQDLAKTNPNFKASVIVCTEALEHDPHFWRTLEYMRAASAPGALWIVTTPANGFPYHGYPRDYYRFTEDAYRDVIFEGMGILDLRTVTPGHYGNAWESAVCGLAQMR